MGGGGDEEGEEVLGASKGAGADGSGGAHVTGSGSVLHCDDGEMMLTTQPMSWYTQGA